MNLMYDEVPIHSDKIGFLKNIVGYEWINQLPTNKNIYITFDLDWGGITDQMSLPMGYEYYILHQYGEQVQFSIIQEQCERVSGLVIVLIEGEINDMQRYFDDLGVKNVLFLEFCTWHLNFRKMYNWHGTNMTPKHILYKASSVSNRLDVHKIIIPTMIAEYIHNDAMIFVNEWVEDETYLKKHIGNITLVNDMHDLFFRNIFKNPLYKDKNFNNKTDNFQKITSSPNQAILYECAINFTNETFARDFIVTGYKYSGPFLTEKTLRCLYSETGFIAVGQHNTYKFLQDLGFEFNYDFDISWDSNEDISQRLKHINRLIVQMSSMSASDIFDMTEKSSKFNRRYILSDEFYKICNDRNNKTVEKIFSVVE